MELPCLTPCDDMKDKPTDKPKGKPCTVLDLPKTAILGAVQYIIGQTLVARFPLECGQLVGEEYLKTRGMNLTIARFIFIYLGEKELSNFIEEEEVFLYNRNAGLCIWASRYQCMEEEYPIDHDLEFVTKKKAKEDREEFNRLWKGELSAKEKTHLMDKHGGDFNRTESMFREEFCVEWEENEYQNAIEDEKDEERLRLENEYYEYYDY